MTESIKRQNWEIQVFNSSEDADRAEDRRVMRMTVAERLQEFFEIRNRTLPECPDSLKDPSTIKLRKPSDE
ncbi:MAG: hypothetical protein ACLFN5_03780 [bacterium]